MSKNKLFALIAAAVLAVSVFSGHTSAQSVQSFCTGTPSGPCTIIGSLPIDWKICYGGATPTGGLLDCNTSSGSSETNIPLASTGLQIDAYQIIKVPRGSLLSRIVTYTPADWGDTAPAPTASTGGVTGVVDALCDGGTEDVVSDNSTPGAGNLSHGSFPWPNPDWNPIPLIRQTIASASTPGVPDVATLSGNGYIDSIKPMPPTFVDLFLDRANVRRIDLAYAIFLDITPTHYTTDVPPPTASQLANAGAPLVNLTTLSPYVPGLKVSVGLLGDQPQPPPTLSNTVCLDSPQSSVTKNTTTIAPAGAGDYVRWAAFESAVDASGQVTRILDTQCVRVGVGTPACDLADSDGDLIPNAVEAINGTCIGPAACGTNPATDSDSDGVDDFVEMFQFTNPDPPALPIVSSTNSSPITMEVTGHGYYVGACVTIAGHTVNTNANGTWRVATAPDANHFTLGSGPSGAAPAGNGVGGATGTSTGVSKDTDCDGSMDKQDNLAGFNCASAGGVCTVANLGDDNTDDNCPADYNPDQLNTDSLPDWTNSPNTPNGAIYRGDATNNHQDYQGDVCDPDDDNDGLTDVVETAGFNHPNRQPGCSGAGTPIAACTGPGPAAGTLYCLPATADPPLGGMSIVTTDPLNPDSDSDGGLDGRECEFGSDPLSAAQASCQPNCATASRFPDAAMGTDPDGDLLFPDAKEIFYRTQNIRLPNGAELQDLESLDAAATLISSCTDPNAVPFRCDNKFGPLDPDSDGDKLNDGVEVKWYATAPANYDTDGDGCSDGKEAADVNGDHKVDSTDALGISQHTTTGALAPGKVGVPLPLGSPAGAYNVAGVRRTNLATYDINKDGKIDSTDSVLRSQIATGSGGGGNCKAGTGAQTGKTIQNSATTS